MTQQQALRAPWLAAGVAMIASLPAHAWEAPETDLKRYCTLTMDYETPHTPGRGPMRGGR